MRGMCAREGRACAARVHCLRALDGRLILSRLPAIGHDLAPALLRAFTLKDGKRKRKVEMGEKKNRTQGKK